MMQADIVSDVAALALAQQIEWISVYMYTYMLEAGWAAADLQVSEKVQLSRHCWKCL